MEIFDKLFVKKKMENQQTDKTEIFTDTLILEMATTADLESAVEQCRIAIMMRTQVVLDQEGRRNTQPDFTQLWWRASVEPQVSLMLIVDEALHCAWVDVSDFDSDRLQIMVKALRDHLPTVSSEKLIMLLQRWPLQRGTMAALAIAQEQASPELLAAVDRALRESDSALVIEAAFAAATAGLTELLPALERALSQQAPIGAEGALNRAIKELKITESLQGLP
jgi:hypothetical protein